MKKIFYGIMFKLTKNIKWDYYYPYCPYCSSCGVDGCCSPTKCVNNKNGYYCTGNMADLKISYWVLKDFTKFLYQDEEKNKELIEKIDELTEITTNEYYEE